MALAAYAGAFVGPAPTSRRSLHRRAATWSQEESYRFMLLVAR